MLFRCFQGWCGPRLSTWCLLCGQGLERRGALAHVRRVVLFLLRDLTLLRLSRLFGRSLEAECAALRAELEMLLRQRAAER
jgi:hypothetical protein